MKCPNCRHEVGENPFCPNCGADMTSSVRRRRRFLRNVDRGVRKGTAAAVILVAAISVLAVVLTTIPAPNSGTDASQEIPDDAIVLSSGAYIVLSGGFGDGTFTASLDSSGQLVIVLSESIASGYTHFRWDLRDCRSAESMTITKETANLTWMEPSIGLWSVTVCCYNTSDDAVEYTGGLECLGDSTTTYAWTHAGTDISLSFTVTLAQYRASSSYSTDDSLASAVSAVDSGGVADSLEERIWQAYSASFSGASRSSADYAACILEMVSSCITLQSDLVTHGVSVHWSSPAETLYLGAGDSGDLAVLAASLLKAAGFDTGIVKYPDGYAVAVAAEPDSTDGLVRIVSGSTTYWISMPSGFEGIGVMPDRYGGNGRTLTFCGSTLPSGCGLSIC